MNRVALVTGAARGIGAATVAALDAAGWSVVAVDRAADDPRLPYALATPAQLEAVVAAAGNAVSIKEGDVTNRSVMTAAVAEAEERFGGLDAVIAVAGVIAGGVPLWDDARSSKQQCGARRRSRRCPRRWPGPRIPALLRRPAPREGRFLAVASTAATRGLPMLAAYGAAKAGVSGLIRGLAAGTAWHRNHRERGGAPGSTDTSILDESARLYGLESAEAFSISNRSSACSRPDEIAAALVWLAGPTALG